MNPRGQIHTPDRARQLNDFRGLQIGTITPTDLDGLIDFHGQSFAFFEIKSEGAQMPRGQELALTRVVDLIESAGKRAALFEVSHTEHDCWKSVDASRCMVRRIYYAGTWTANSAVKGMTLRAAVDRFLGLIAAAAEPVAPIDCPSADDIFGRAS